MNNSPQTPAPLSLAEYLEMEDLTGRLNKTDAHFDRLQDLKDRWKANPVPSWTDQELESARKEQIIQFASL